VPLLSNKKQANQPTRYLRRLAENEYVRTQFRDAATALGNLSRWIAERRGTKLLSLTAASGGAALLRNTDRVGSNPPRGG
jgi:hypothetical protein